ncbi:MAG TPA: NAD-dependent epimerase/dehydratase family protein [Spirochaetota bacterium]|nr:NAD-dependent epimerase/dehydratase family protein [Spirochaetota bacterium]HOL57127.1 NAD-dependent epimerase/dehydratase family protein [Spirochaetota bacterium]HPP04682.1 NAD-dependent epimerase/dehydratase family protein [Spirochaetota bacterium]
MEKIFITGGAGFIGSHLVEELYKENEIIVYDNLKSGFIDNIKNFKNVTFIKDDILNYDSLKKAMKGCTKVFHLAAEISVAESMKDPIFTEKVNTHGTINVLNAMISNNIKNIVFASSAAVYGNSPECPKKVDMPLSPVSPYAISKLSGEYYVKMYSKEYGIKGVITRFFNVFGERQNPNSTYAAAMPIFISRALNNNEITIFGDGKQTRDFIYVKDLVNYLIRLSDSGNGIYNIGYGKYITINNLVLLIKKLTNSSSVVKYDLPRPGDVKYSYADVTRIKDEIKIDLIGLEEGIKRTINYFKSL